MNRKIFRFIWPVALVITLTGCYPKGNQGFGLYLVSGVEDPRLIDEIGLDVVSLEPEPLFSEPDILVYDLQSREMTLTPEAFQAVLAVFTLPIDVDGIPFVVMIDDARIFHGAFYSPASSLSFDGGVVLDPMDPLANVIRFDFGYPGPGPEAGPDPLGDARITDWAENR